MIKYYRCIKNQDTTYKEYWKIGNVYVFSGNALTTDCSYQGIWITTRVPLVEFNTDVIDFEEVFPKTRIVECTSSLHPDNNEFVEGRIYQYDVDEGKLYCESPDPISRNYISHSMDENLDSLIDMLSSSYKLCEISNVNKTYFRCSESIDKTIWKLDFIYEYSYGGLSTEQKGERIQCNLQSLLDNTLYGYKFEKVNLFDEEEINANIEDTSVIDKLLDSLRKMLEREKLRINSEVIQYKEDYNNYRKSMTTFYNKWQTLKVIADAKTNTKELEDKIIKEITSIQEHKSYNHMSIDSDNLIIKTKHLYIIEPNTGRRYSLGKMSFCIPLLNDRSISIYNDTTNRNGYSNNMHHPHIFEQGEPCWGNVEPMIADYITTKEYYALFITILNFCQTVDIDDSAGWYVSCWDEVDKDGDIIEDGHKPSADEYDGYGCCEETEDVYEYEYYCERCDIGLIEEDTFWCENCESYFCEDHAEYYEELGYSLCHHCRDEYYIECSDCGRLIQKDTNEYYTTDRNVICEHCYDDSYFTCEDCEEIVHNKDMSEEEGLCYNCYTMHRETESEVV